MTRCSCCGAQIIDGTCHCGAEGRKMREASAADARDAAKAYEFENPTSMPDTIRTDFV